MRGKKARWRLYGLLICIVWLAFGLRLLNADGSGFWTDEGLTPLRASYSPVEILSNRIIIQEAVTNDTHPPLFYLLIHVSRRLWGETDFAFRYLSLLAGVLLAPLLYQFGRRLHNRRLGLTAALATAVNPLQIYYANEARMYTLLVLLTAAASYVLWRALQKEDRKPAGRSNQLSFSLFLYIMLAGLALYTHYVTAFLIAGQSVFWVWLLWRRGHKRLLAGTAIIVSLLAIPLIPFTVPRLFTGAEANYYYVSPLIMLQDVVRFFHLGRSVDFESTAVKLLNLGALALLLLGLYAPRHNRQRAFLLIYLLAVVLGLMAGSLLIKPMYQGVRHIMVGSPAFLLLASWALVFAANRYSLFRHVTARPLRVWPTTHRPRPTIALLGAVILFGGSLAAVANYYFDTRFGKDDFRGMIAFIEERAGQNDVVVYHNAILLPLHAHYQTRPDVALAAVPLYPHLAADVAAAQLEQLAATYDRLWFVTDPPADGRDLEAITHAWLAENLAEVASYTFPAYTTEVRTIVYDSAPRAVATVPPGAQSLALTWPELPRLAGIALNFAQPTAVPTLWFSLYWQGKAPPAGAAMRFNLQDSRGFTWWAVHDTLLLPERAVWPDSVYVRQSYPLPLTPGILPGVYTLLAQPVAGIAGDPIGPAQPLAEVSVAPGSEWPAPPAVAGSPAIRFENGVALADLQIVDTIVRPGHTLPLNLYWQTGPEAATNLVYEVEVMAANGRLLRTQSDPIGAGWLDELPPQTLLWEHTGLYFPPETAPGRYRLRWQLRDGETVVKGQPFWLPWRRDRLFYGAVNVLPWPLETKLPVDVEPLAAGFGPDILLYGHEATQTPEALELLLVWQTVNQPAENYLLFVHLVNEREEIVSQIDPIPGGQLRPTKGWRPGEVLTDRHSLPLPPDLPAGEYKLWIGLWQPETGLRLPVLVDGVQLPDGRLLLQTITVTTPFP